MMDAAHWTTRLAELARQAGVPGAVLGIWAGGQEVLAASGLLNRATRVRVSTGSLFQIGSITKLWTATMIMQLIDEGLLSLDTTVTQALPGVRLGAADLGDRITVAHLLTHTSGIDGDIFTLAQPEELILHPADASGLNYVCRSHDDQPWVPVSFGRLADHTPYLFAGGRVTPRTG